MSAVPNANKVQSLAAKLANRFKEANPNQGFGGLGPWPNEPTDCDIVCDIDVIVVNWEGKFVYTNPQNKQRVTIPCLEFQPKYIWQECPTGPFRFVGRPLQIPYDIPALDNQKTRVRMAEERVRGQLAGLLGYIPDDLGAALTEVNTLMENAKAARAAVSVQVHLSYPIDKKTGKVDPRNKDDYIRAVTSGTVDSAGDSGDDASS